MLFKPLPQNFDFLILNDHLYQALQKSKQTKHLINLRAEEIVKSILKESLQSQIYQKYKQSIETANQKQEICLRLQKEMETIKEKLQKSKNSLVRELKSENQQILIQANAELSSKDEQIASLELEISQLEQAFNQIQEQNDKIVRQNMEKLEDIERLAKQVGESQKKIQQLQEYSRKSRTEMERILFSHQQQMDKNFAKQKGLTNTIKEFEEKFRDQTQQIEQLTQAVNEKQSFDVQKSVKVQSQLKKSNRQVQKLKKQLKESEQNYNLLKKQISKFRDKYKNFEEEYNKMRQGHADQQSSKDKTVQNCRKEIQDLNKKITELTSRNGTLTKSKAKMQSKMQKLQKIISKSLFTLKQQNSTLRSSVKENFHLIKEYSETLVTKVVNHLSTELSQYFQECIFQIKRAREEKSLAKQEVKIKTEMIEQLDKMLNNEAKSVYDLRFELKQKIREEEKLRKKLKHHYQETDKKLEDFQTKYISILKNEF